MPSDFTATSSSRKRERRGRGELVLVLVVVGLRLALGDADLAGHLDLLHLVDHHLLLEVLAQLLDGDAFLLEGGVELLVGFELVLLADVLEHALELLVGDLVAELLAALEQQQFVDGVHQDVGRDRRNRLLQLLVGHLLRALAKRRDLAVLELGLGDDLAVHLDQDLLDDLDLAADRGRGGRGGAWAAGGWRRAEPAGPVLRGAGGWRPARRRCEAVALAVLRRARRRRRGEEHGKTR